jgi:hypothetical protein
MLSNFREAPLGRFAPTSFQNQPDVSPALGERQLGINDCLRRWEYGDCTRAE